MQGHSAELLASRVKTSIRIHQTWDLRGRNRRDVLGRRQVYADSQRGQFFCQCDRLIKRRTGCNYRCAGDDPTAKTLSDSSIDGVVSPKIIGVDDEKPPRRRRGVLHVIGHAIRKAGGPGDRSSILASAGWLAG